MSDTDLKKHLYILILCGGSGTRLWPRSRQKTPKQFLPSFFGKNTIFAQTVERAQKITSSEKIFVITNSDFVDEVIIQGKVIPPRNIIAEPQAKNTAMAMGVGAAYIKKVDPEAIIINLYSDHLIQNQQLLVETGLKAAQAAASGNFLVTIGLKPQFPHTGLGYIESGGELENSKGVFKATAFKEKPDLETAKLFLEKGNYFWNVGYYCWSADSIMKAFEKYSPDLFPLIDNISRAITTDKEAAVLKECYEKAKNISIDVEIAEKADNKLLVTADFDWSDVGDWQVVYQAKPKDENQNVLENFGDGGWAITLESKNCLVETNKRLVALIGVNDLAVVETDDSVLVCARDRAQDVKKIVETLREKNKTEYL